ESSARSVTRSVSDSALTSGKARDHVTTNDMLEALRRLVEAESYSGDPDGIEACGRAIDELCGDLLGQACEPAGPHLMWKRQGDRPVLLLCHFDTVWPPGTLSAFPFRVEEGVARGPGTFDMKAGIVQCLWALRSVDTGPVTVLFTADEEIGSPTSRPLIEEHARDARAALVLEPASGSSVKVARKGVAQWRLDVTGRAAHAGLAPEEGINAAVELAGQIDRLQELARPDDGTTVTVTTMAGGSASNVVPESAWCTIDARMWSVGEADRLASELAKLEPALPGARLAVTGGLGRAPLERDATEALYGRLMRLGYEVGGAAVGGASDGNITGGLGTPTLDGLGAVGGGAHARTEHVLVDEMPRRAEMVARLVEDLLSDG
ncbi:MAG TPA: M20 family metallopeptidase, partial [Actinomycetota bacterium]|nr:M20 family metallopeptidase [Actinomycetota bacterium]